MSDWDSVSDAVDTSGSFDGYTPVADNPNVFTHPSGALKYLNTKGQMIEIPAPSDSGSDQAVGQVSWDNVSSPYEAKPEGDKGSRGGAFGEGILQGATLGTSGRIEAGIGTGLANTYAHLPDAVQEATLGKIDSQDLPSYNEARQEKYNQTQANAQEYPAESIVGNIAGSIPTVLAGGAVLKSAAPGAAKFLANSGSRLAAGAKGAALGAGQGAITGTMEADPNDPNAMTNAAESGAILGGVLGGGLSAVLPKQITRAPVSQEIKDSLFGANAEAKVNVGEQLGGKISAAEQVAQKAKEAAYTEAGQAKAAVPSTSINALADSIEESVKHLDPEVEKSVAPIRRYVQDLRNISTNPGANIKYSVLESLRKRINSIPYTAETAQGKMAAKAAFDKHIDQIVDDGLIKGDKKAIELIKEARAKNAYWRETFSGNNADKAIKKFVESGGEMSPEAVTKLFTNLNDAGYQSVKAIKGALGEDGISLVKQGYLNNIGLKSMKDGEIDPISLSKNVAKFIQDNPTIAKTILTEEEFKSLQAIAANGGKAGLPGLVKWLGKKASILGFFSDTLSGYGGGIGVVGGLAGKGVGNAIEKTDKALAIKQLQNPIVSKNYPGLMGGNRYVPN